MSKYSKSISASLVTINNLKRKKILRKGETVKEGPGRLNVANPLAADAQLDRNDLKLERLNSKLQRQISRQFQDNQVTRKMSLKKPAQHESQVEEGSEIDLFT
ncbi:hypothetical protein FGO68_gene13268 [Halteria grandinella]|uniref:Uncharacterized protein n=1 Tax=Halteria grandinella TaxID=5974 RepID=A0A8J8NG54_HALGN|nr:hypothetical protein FGO68_gene13268 [Halteria grandinella]